MSEFLTIIAANISFPYAQLLKLVVQEHTGASTPLTVDKSYILTGEIGKRFYLLGIAFRDK